MDSDAQEQPKAVFPSEGRATDQMSIEGQNKNCDPMPMEELGKGHPSNFSTCYGTDNSTVGNNSTAAVNSTCHSTAGVSVEGMHHQSVGYMSSIADTSSILCDSRSSSSLGVAPKIDDFVLLKPISRGAFGKVFLCHKKDQPDRKLAVKVMKKTDLVEKNLVTQAIAERNALAITKSPFCVNLYYCLQTHNNMFLVMEYMIGGDLKSLLGVYGYFEESMAVFYIAEVILALEYLHKKGIVHRDVKPDNMLISSTGHLKLTDFGLSNVGINRELQVADLLPNTPWISKSKAQDYKLIRTPGQILSLTSHLSFVSNGNGTNASSTHREESHSLGGSFSQDTSHSRPASRMFGSLGHAVSHSKSHQLLEPEEEKMSICSSAIKDTPCTKASKSSSHATPATRGIKLTRKKSFIDVISQHQSSMETSQNSGPCTSSFGPALVGIDIDISNKGTNNDGYNDELCGEAEDDFVLPPPSSSFDNGHQDKTLESCSSYPDLNLSQYDDVFSDKENQSPVKELASKSCTELGQRSFKPYSLQTSMEESSSRTGFRLGPGAAAVTGFQQPVFSSTSFHGQELLSPELKSKQKGVMNVSRSPLKDNNGRPIFYIGSPDENSQSSLSSSPKAISCPPTSHPNISPVDKSASSSDHMSFSITPPHTSSSVSSLNTVRANMEPVPPRYPDFDEINAEKITPTFPVNFGESRLQFSQARLNMAGIRQGSPENLRDGESFNSDIQLESATNTPPPNRSEENNSSINTENTSPTIHEPVLVNTADVVSLLAEAQNTDINTEQLSVRECSSPPRPMFCETPSPSHHHHPNLGPHNYPPKPCLPSTSSYSGEENEGRLRKSEILDSPDFNHLNAMDTEGSPAIHVSVPGASRSNPLLPQLQPRSVKFKSPDMGTDVTSGKRKRAASGSTGSSSSCGSHITATADGASRHTGLTQDLSEMLRKRSCPNLRQYFGAPHSNVDTNNVFAEVISKSNVDGTEKTNAGTRMSVDSTNNSKLKLDQDVETCTETTHPSKWSPGHHDTISDISKISHNDPANKHRSGTVSTMSTSSEEAGAACTTMSVSSDGSNESKDGKRDTMSTSSTGSDDREQGEHPKLEYQYSTPLSAVPSHLKMLKNKMVQFLSPAGVTPVSHPVHPAISGRQPQMSVSTPLSMVDLNQISRIKSPLQPMSLSTAETPQRPSAVVGGGSDGGFQAPPPPQFHTPPPQSQMHSVATPFRTPKSVRRRKHESTDVRILGTPDYLAPELLLRQAHDAGVDWWAVGVCLYEFMTGIPPFNDTTPDLVFNNILALNIDWPEGEEALSDNAVEAIMAFLRLEQEKRANGKTIKEYALMKDVCWDNILEKIAPFVPQPDNDADTTYFQTRNSMQGLKVSQIDI